MTKVKKKRYPPSILERDITYGKFYLENEHGIKGLIKLGISFFDSCTETDIFGVCAQMAFTLLFALLPTLMFIILICSQFIPNFEPMFYSLIQLLLPSASFDYISEEIGNLFIYLNRIGPFIIILSAVMGTLSAHTFLMGINQTYGYEKYNSAKWEWFKSLLILLVFILTLVVLTSFFLYMCSLADQILKERLSSKLILNFDTAVFDIMLVLGVFIVLTGIYWFTPQRRITLKQAIPGAVFSTVGILIIFRIYIAILNRSSNYLAIYGSLSGLFVLLTAFYFICVILNFGAKINVFFSYKTRAVKYDKIIK